MVLSSHGYPVEAGRIEAAVVGVESCSETYYEVKPGSVLVTGTGRIEGGAYWLRCLCGHLLFTEELTGHGFGWGCSHVACPKCAEGLPAECTE